MQDWQAADVAWSMWITSLITGLLYIYVTAFTGKLTLKHKKTKSSAKLTASIFMAVFFTFHFGFFHFVHSEFMRGFFPLDALAEGSSFITLIITTISLYYGFILVGILRMMPQLLGGEGGNAVEINIATPYAFVIRNHIMIILLGGLTHFVDSQYIVYLVIAFYFFPFDTIFKKNDRSETQSS